MLDMAVQAPPESRQRATLLDLLDRLLGKGVVAYGDVILSIAELDLVYLNLRAVLSSIGTIEEGGLGSPSVPSLREGIEPAGPRFEPTLLASQVTQPHPGGACTPETMTEESGGAPPLCSATAAPHPDTPGPGRKLDLDPERAEQGLAKLVLTIINLLRRLMERQAIRRMEAGTLSPEQLERAGHAFRRLEERIQELSLKFGLDEEDLNLDLGPLGELL